MGSVETLESSFLHSSLWRSIGRLFFRVSAVGFLLLVLIFLSYLQRVAIPTIDPVVNYYILAVPVLTFLFPFSMALLLKMTNRLGLLTTVSVVGVFLFAFFFMVPVVSTSIYVDHCQRYDNHGQSLGYFLLGLGFHYDTLFCI